MIPLTLSGPPRHRGRAYGEAFRERIASAIDAWFGHLSERIEPQDFVADLCHRSGLRTGVDEALALLGRTPGASGDSYTPGTRDRSTVVEVSADGMGIVHDGDRALHTNHPLKLAPMVERRLESSENRLDQLERTVRPDATVDEIAAMFAGGPVCKNRNNDGPVVTVATMIFELADEPICHFAPGPLDSDALVSYAFRSGA